MLIFRGPFGGGGCVTDIGYVNIVGQGEGVGGQTLGMIILGEGV